ncbi:MAG: hypothetical protein ACR2N7_04290 [Acidimicrobiia bacterium]
MPKEDSMFSYIDPAAGATIMQLVVAGTVGIGAVVKLKWTSIKSLFTRSDAGDDAPETTDLASDDVAKASTDFEQS